MLMFFTLSYISFQLIVKYLFVFSDIMLKQLLLLVILGVSVKGQCFYKDDSSKKLDPAARTSLYRGQLEFTLNLFNAINKVVPDDNVFFSPFSIYQSLLLTYFSSGGKTEQSLKESLRIEEKLVSIYNNS